MLDGHLWWGLLGTSGLYPEVSLATARERQVGARSLLESGVDPGEFKKTGEA